MFWVWTIAFRTLRRVVFEGKTGGKTKNPVGLTGVDTKMVAGPRRRKAACLSTAGKAEERKAIAQKTGHGFMGELRKNRKR